jgi:hypothetical protein
MDRRKQALSLLLLFLAGIVERFLSGGLNG